MHDGPRAAAGARRGLIRAKGTPRTRWLCLYRRPQPSRSSIFPGSAFELPHPLHPSCIYKLFAVGGTRRAVSRQKIDARGTLPKDIDRRFRTTTTVRSAARWKLGNFGRAPVYSPTTLEPRSLEDEAYVYRGTVRRSDGKFSAACINGRNTKSLSVAGNNFAITSDCAVCRIRKAFTILGGNIAYKNFEAIRKEYTTNF